MALTLPSLGLGLLARSVNLLINGDFTTGTTGWTASEVTGGAASVLSVVAGKMRVTNTGATFGTAYQIVPTVVGKSYSLVIGNLTIASAVSAFLRVGTSLNGTENVNSGLTGTDNDRYTFTATGTSTYVTLGNGNNSGGYNEWDNLSMRAA